MTINHYLKLHKNQACKLSPVPMIGFVLYSWAQDIDSILTIIILMRCEQILAELSKGSFSCTIYCKHVGNDLFKAIKVVQKMIPSDVSALKTSFESHNTIDQPLMSQDLRNELTESYQVLVKALQSIKARQQYLQPMMRSQTAAFWISFYMTTVIFAIGARNYHYGLDDAGDWALMFVIIGITIVFLIALCCCCRQQPRTLDGMVPIPPPAGSIDEAAQGKKEKQKEKESSQQQQPQQEESKNKQIKAEEHINVGSKEGKGVDSKDLVAGEGQSKINEGTKRKSQPLLSLQIDGSQLQKPLMGRKMSDK